MTVKILWTNTIQELCLRYRFEPNYRLFLDKKQDFHNCLPKDTKGLKDAADFFYEKFYAYTRTVTTVNGDYVANCVLSVNNTLTQSILPKTGKLSVDKINKKFTDSLKNKYNWLQLEKAEGHYKSNAFLRAYSKILADINLLVQKGEKKPALYELHRALVCGVSKKFLTYLHENLSGDLYYTCSIDILD